MSAHMKKHRTESSRNMALLYVEDGNDLYAIPKSVAKEYKINPKKAVSKSGNVRAEDLLKELRGEESKACFLLKGLRYREGLSQVEFAKRIDITQANLSRLECGRRPVGRTIAKRIADEFDLDYRSFLE